MTGPVFTKSTLSVNLSDVSRELNIPKEQSVVETGISEGKQVCGSTCARSAQRCSSPEMDMKGIYCTHAK